MCLCRTLLHREQRCANLFRQGLHRIRAMMGILAIIRMERTAEPDDEGTSPQKFCACPKR